ncbi:heat shock 70 kDa protein 12B-like, partial [Mercenaria mercenaria]|uniref:heat shock 70 kDa protein 12B-like n=1 Tax=Mercenaria mercenaria TaxID=6596 RepID=UPI00234FA51A
IMMDAKEEMEKSFKEDKYNWEPRLVVAVDFGTSGTGFAFQLRNDYEANHHKMYYDSYLSRNNNRKNSTAVLISKDFSNSYFGVQAEDLYRRSKDPTKWYFFRHFKMQMYRDKNHQDICSGTKLKDVNGNLLPAETVFGESLKCLIAEVYEMLEKANINILEHFTKWVITVPAIWNDGAKAVMRNAAALAGIKSRYLTIALEPEAAVIYYAMTDERPNEPSGSVDQKMFARPGFTYMVADIGAGTSDITTIRITENGKMKRIHEAVGGPAVGETMDRRLIEIVADLFGEKIWKKFANERSRHYAKFRESVENAKIELEYDKFLDFFDDNVMLTMPEGVLWELAKEMEEEDLAVAIEKRGKRLVNGRLKFADGNLCFDVDFVRKIMLESVAEVLKYIKNVIESEKGDGQLINAVILVGGFALSEFIFKAIQNYIDDVRVMRPLHCSMAVLRGAVLFGQNESLLNVRIGIACNKPFVRGDPKERKVKYDGKICVKDHFSKQVTRGQEVQVNEWTESIECLYPLIVDMFLLL